MRLSPLAHAAAFAIVLAFGGCSSEFSDPSPPGPSAGLRVACSDASQCSASPCRVPVCNGGYCATEPAPAGPLEDAAQIAHDCRAVSCDGQGAIVLQPKADDPPEDDGNPCTEEKCAPDGSIVRAALSDKVCGKDRTCNKGFCVPRSCVGAKNDCGPAKNESCCADSVVEGGTFKRNRVGELATISTFRLDRFEVTVSRFRKFVEAGWGVNTDGKRPTAGQGAHPTGPGTGWQDAWNGQMSANLLYYLKQGCGAGGTWTDAAAANERLPLNCASWYEAAAFCIFDGGRLPSSFEWNYAAQGGGDARMYPWSDPPTSSAIDATRAVFSVSAPVDVGSRSPKGDGRYGQADLSGNLAEWVFDTEGAAPSSCSDCVVTAGVSYRITRNASFANPPEALVTETANNVQPSSRINTLGFRCVHP